MLRADGYKTCLDLPNTPHGGWKSSGWGRFNGAEGLRNFTQVSRNVSVGAETVDEVHYGAQSASPGSTSRHTAALSNRPPHHR